MSPGSCRREAWTAIPIAKMKHKSAAQHENGPREGIFNFREAKFKDVDAVSATDGQSTGSCEAMRRLQQPPQ